MISRLCILAFGTLFVVTLSAGAQTLDTRLRRLEKEISAVRGLEFKAPVQAKTIKRPEDASKTLQGYYVPREKTLYLYDDLAGNYEKGVLIHEMVHALQDQHFDLEKLKVSLHRPAPGSDRELALAALIEGDATFTMIEVLKNEQPKVAGMLEVPLEKAKNLQNAFLYAQGARYVKALKEKGGWSSVNGAYRFPPRSTLSILNLGGASLVDLGPGTTLGALDLLQKLAKNAATRDDAMKVALGWRGGSVRSSAAGSATLFACKDSAHAALLADALRKLYPTSEIVIQAQTRVHLYEAADAKALQTLRDSVEGPPKVTVFSRSAERLISFGEMIEELLRADLVCIGEDHDSDLHHRLQLQIIKALHACDERLGVGLEMFQKPYQKAVERFLQGAVSEEEFLRESEYVERWGYDWSLYRPIAEFCRRNRLSLAALNVPKELTKRISQVGITRLTEVEKKDLGPVDLGVKEHRDYWFERLPKLHGNSKATAEEKERSYQVMATWDDFMARSAADFQRQRGLRRLVILAGSGHVNRGFGIPERAARALGGTVLTIGIVNKEAEVVTDYQIRIP
jgi:uncharacterized iron-regulated protein